MDEIKAADPEVDANLLREVTEREIKRLEGSYKEDVDTIITSEKYGFINGALKETLKKSTTKNRKNLTEAIDTILPTNGSASLSSYCSYGSCSKLLSGSDNTLWTG